MTKIIFHCPLKILISFLVWFLASVYLATGLAEVSVGRGQSCSPLERTITQNWSAAKMVMLPHKAKLKKVDRDSFYCLSPQYTRNVLERRVAPGSGLRCYSDPDRMGLGICCDANLSTCARLRPELVPEAFRQKKEKEYKKSASDWVKPPSDKDQW